MCTSVEHEDHCWRHCYLCRNQIDLQGELPKTWLPDQSAKFLISKTADELLSRLTSVGHAWLTWPAWHQQPHKTVPQAPATTCPACTQAKGRLHRRLQADMLSLDSKNLGRIKVGLSEALLP